MSLDVLREGALTSKKHELTAVARSQSASLRALREVTAILTNNTGVSRLENKSFDSQDSPPDDSEESAWLKNNSLLSGRYLIEDSVLYPTIAQDATSIYPSKPNSVSIQPAEQAQAATTANAPATEAALTSPATTTTNIDDMAAAALQKPCSLLPEDGHVLTQQAPGAVEGPTAMPGTIAAPQPEEEANFNGATEDLSNLESPEKPAKTVHLPPQDVQEERLREQEAEQRKRSSSQRSQPSRLHIQTEPASSPSSTVDARSAATPMPPQESPDTSPDSETVMEEVQPPKDLRPSPEEQAQKDEHDRLLEAQKEIVRKQALGDFETPDEQWEEREAAARDAEEQAARAEANGPESVFKVAGEGSAEQIVEAMVVDEQAPQPPATTVAERMGLEVETAVTHPTTSGDPLQPLSAQEDGDNITVTPRSKATKPFRTYSQPPLESVSQPTAVTSEAEGRDVQQHRDLTHPESSTDNIDGETVLRRRSSFGPVSPMTTRHPHDLQLIPPATPLQTAHQPQRPPSQHQTPPNSYPTFGELVALKGAADDPDMDYLEPLFKIQANDAAGIRTSPLPDLIRSASKTLTTADQFTSMHERQDYRILRRIYQLQNANKWSLRQMQKCKEPERTVTHHDHMMAEMKWLRKDFKAERKMKKSVCAWLAQRCADYVDLNGRPEEQRRLRVNAKQRGPKGSGLLEEPSIKEEQLPELEVSGDSAPEDDMMPRTPTATGSLPTRLIIEPEFVDAVTDLRKCHNLKQALEQLPVAGRRSIAQPQKDVPTRSMTLVSKYVGGKVVPRHNGPIRKRSRFDYEDAEEAGGVPSSKRVREEGFLAPEDQDNALFHPDNKHIRDRLHANNAFRPPSEFQMPATPFYEFRNGSQWIWEDDQRLRKFAKDYSFNWSLIAEEMTLPSRYKSGMERRTPWECFERWVELETLPAEMRKTMYFKTWHSRLEQSQQAVDRRYQAQVAMISAQQNGGQQGPVPMRRRTLPSRVEKRKNTRYLWLVDAMRKLARKREGHAFKQAEAQRAAAQRKSQTDNNQPRGPMLTPQEFSKKRYERDCLERAHRQKLIEAQQKQAQIARAAQQQGLQNGAQQRPATAGAPTQQGQMQVNAQHAQNMNGQMPSQPRQALPMAMRNGHLAVPQLNAQGIPQAQMRAPGAMAQHPDMQRIAHANAQARNSQYGGQQYQMPNASMVSPGSGMSTQQQIASNQALLTAAFQSQQSGNQTSGQGPSQTNGGHQMSQSPGMPPPPTPSSMPQQLSSGHVPALIHIKSQLRIKYPKMPEDQLTNYATEQLKHQSQSSNQVRQNAMNAAAGINGTPVPAPNNNMQVYNHNQAAFHNNSTMNNGPNGYVNGDGSNQQPSMSGTHTSPQQYAQMMRQRQMQQMHMQSPSASRASLNGSPGLAHASPNMAPASPSVQYSSINNMAGVGMNGTNGQRPPSRSNTPQMQRIGSSGSAPPGGVPGMQSPGAGGLQGSPRTMQAGMAR